MILPQKNVASWGGSLAGRISSDIAEACAQAGDRLDIETRREVANAVAGFAAREHPVSSGYLALLVARALWSVGAENTARRLMENKSPEFGLDVSHSYAAFAPEISLERWWAIVSIRAVRPSSVFSSEEGGSWTLDLQCAFGRGGSGLEMALFSVLERALEQMAPLWDVHDGHGSLGLRHIEAAAVSVLGRDVKIERMRSLFSEIMSLCSCKMSMLRDERGWRRHPHVLSLDFHK
jgi:hypothetical protein